MTMKELNAKKIWLLSERKINEKVAGSSGMGSPSSILGNHTYPSEDGEVLLKKLPFMQEI